MAGPDRKPQIFPKARSRSAARCLPHPRHWEPAWPHNEKSPARCAKKAKEIAAAQPFDLQTAGSNGLTSTGFYQYFRPGWNFGQELIENFRRTLKTEFTIRRPILPKASGSSTLPKNWFPATTALRKPGPMPAITRNIVRRVAVAV